MFWDSLVAGLKVLTYWEIYVAAIEYLVIFWVPIALAGLLIANSESAEGVIGCLGMLLMPVLQVVAMAIMLLTIAPIIFGFAEEAAWSFPWKVLSVAPGAFFRLIGVLIVAAIILAFVPILGQLQSLQTLVLGGITLTFVLGIIDSAEPGLVQGRVDFLPGFWFSVGLIVIGGILSWIAMICVAAALSLFELVDEGIGQMLMVPFASIFGFIPVFIYGAWLGSQVRGSF